MAYISYLTPEQEASLDAYFDNLVGADRDDEPTEPTLTNDANLAEYEEMALAEARWLHGA